MKRRDFLLSASAAISSAALPKFAWTESNQVSEARLELQPNVVGPWIDPEFLGLSFETAQLAHPEYFSASNHPLVEFLRALAPRGVLRIGGNTSEFAFWTPEPGAAQPADAAGGAVGPDKGHKPAPPTQTTPLAIRNLREFLDATGWRAYYGLNLGQGTPERAAAEAAYVFDTLGDRLILFQIGNESDLFGHNGLRARGYDYAAFAQDWKRFHDAIVARVPGAKFGGPDTAITGMWVREFAQQFGPQVEMLSTHYYAEGPASDPSMNIERLLAPANSRWDNGLPQIRAAMEQSHLPFRLAETNSCYGGGKEGVSDTFASALWAADLMLELASIGANGINLHGGGYGWYAPIVGTIPNGFSARPEYYGLLLMAQLLGGRMMQSKLHSGDALLKTYAAVAPNGMPAAVVLNKDGGRAYRMTVQSPLHATRIRVQRMLAPRLDDRTDATFAGAPVGANGAWQPERVETLAVQHGSAHCIVPAGSAALLFWE